MAGTGVGKFSSTAGNNTANMTVNFAENMAPSNVNNAARELMGHMRDMYEQLGDGYFEFGDGDGTYTVARSDADTITITSSSDISSVYFAGRKIRITDGGANVVEGTIASSSHSSTTQTVNLTGISLASGTPTKVELGIDTAAFGGRVILDDDGDTYIEAPTDDTIDIYVAGAKDFVITANTFTAESGSTIAAQALTATSITATGDISLDGGSFVFNESSADKDFRVESNGNTHMLFVDGGNDKVGIGTSSLTGTFHVKSTDAGTTMYIEDSHAGDGDGPELYLYRNSASPADNDSIGIVKFLGRNDNSQDVIYGQMQSIILDASDGTEDAKTVFNNMIGGSSLNMLQFDNTGVVINESSNDLDFRVESNGNTHMLFVDGGNDHVNIGGSSDLGGMFNVAGNGVFQNADQTDTLSLVNTDADANVGPRLKFFRDSGSPANADMTGDIRFEGKNNAAQDVVYAQIVSQINEITDGQEDGILSFKAMIAGTIREGIRFSDGGVVFNELSQDIDLRVESNGHTDAFFVDAGQDEVFFFANDTPDGSNRGGAMFQASTNERAVLHCSTTATDAQSLIVLNNGNGTVGTIQTNSSATSYNTSSDYRLKENVNYTWDATTELKKLKPAKFNFKADASTTVEGFLAHEVSSIVPIAVTGDKDGVDENGDPEYQGIDQSKLVPLMVKTIQELEARIVALES